MTVPPPYATTNQGTRWMFTIFDDIETVDPTTWHNVRYLVYQVEETPTTGVLHIQGYVVFTEKKRLGACKKVHRTADWRCCKGTHEQCIAYCTKEESQVFPPITVGDPNCLGRGKRNDLMELKVMIDSGLPVSQMYNEHYGSMIRYKKNLLEYKKLVDATKELARLKEKFTVPTFQLKHWQEDAITDLLEQDDRTIQWIWDEDGGLGKTTVGKYILTHYNAFLCLNGKIADVAHAYDGQEYVVMDYTRDYEGMINYSLLESFKNGFIFSPKYDSQVKIFTPCKVLCLANFAPDESKLSADRWSIKKITPFTL